MKRVSKLHRGNLSFWENSRQTIALSLWTFFLFAALPVWAGINEWTSNGPAGGTAQSLAISPNYGSDNTVFTGIQYSGVYKSTNGGLSWLQINNGLTNMDVQSLAVSPNYSADNTNTIFAGTNPSGVFKSTNGGASWTQTNLTNVTAYSVAVSPVYSSDNTVFVGASAGGASLRGIYKSTDGGTSWTQTSLTNMPVLSVAISPNYSHDNTVFAGTNSNGVYKTTDGGQTWNQINIGLNTSYQMWSLAISPNYSTDNTIFVGTYGDGVYKSTDGGASWTKVGLPNYVYKLAISPNYSTDNTVFCGGSPNGVYQSVDGGQSWTQINNGLSNTNVLSMVVTPNYGADNTVFAGTNGNGVFSYTFPYVAIQLPKTGQTTSYAPGDDGDIQAGVAWPDPKFTDNGNGTITDNLTGLIWLKNANCFGGRTWSQALSDANMLASGSCGLTDGSSAGNWRLPNVIELESLVHAGQSTNATWLNLQGFTDVLSNGYWTSTTLASQTNEVWYVDMDNYGVSNEVKDNIYYVLPLRDAQSGSTVNLPITGQNVSYALGDDGHLQKGISWPNPRFTDNGNGTVTDNLTGLIWLRDANCANSSRTWANAYDDVVQLNTDGTMNGNNCGDTSNGGTHRTDWRLPNLKELRSLIDYSQYNPSLPTIHPFFVNVSEFSFWSSTTVPYLTDYAWYVDTHHGFLIRYSKANSYYVWPVRGGILTTPIDTTPPTTVTLSGNVVNSSRIDLSWTASADTGTGVDHYEIYNAANNSLIDTTTSTSYSHTGLLIPTTYSYYVKAVDGVGNKSAASNVLRTTVLPCITQPWFFDLEPNNSINDPVRGFPRNIVPTYHVFGHIDYATDEDWYQVYAYEGQTISSDIQVQSTGTDVGWSVRKPSGEILFQQTGLGTSIPTSTASYTVQVGEEGYYKMRIWNVNNNRIPTRYYFNVEKTPQTDTLAPTTVTNITSTVISSTEVQLSWDASTDVVGPIEYTICNVDRNLLVDTTAATTINITNLNPGTTYNFRVVSADAGGNFSSGDIVTVATPAAPAGMVAYWRFDEGSGDTAYDSIGSNDGILVNGPTWSTGIVNDSISFNGINNYVQVYDNDLWAFTNDFTIELWAKFNSNPGGTLIGPGAILVSHSEGQGVTNKWTFEIGDEKLAFHINAPPTYPNAMYFLAQAPFSPTLNQWYHLAVTRNGNIYTTYINGIPIASESSNIIISNPYAELTIGYAEDLFYMDGLIDELAIYHTALSAGEIQQHYQNGLIGFGYDTPSDTTSPTGSVTINSGASSTNSITVTLSLPCSDPSGCSQMCISNTNSCSSWESYAASKAWTLSSGDGTKTVYTWFVDGIGNINSTPFTDTIVFDTTPPTTVTLSGNLVNSSRIDISWTASTDTGSGVDHYEIYNASNNSLIDTTTSTTYSHTGLSIPTTYNYYIKAVDGAGNKSSASNTLRTTVLPCFTQPIFIDFEPNDSIDDAVTGFARNIVPSYHFYSYINNATDVDRCKFYAYEGQRIEVSINVPQPTGAELGWQALSPGGLIGHQQTGLGTTIFSDTFIYDVPPGGSGYYSGRVWNVNGNNASTRFDFNIKVTPQSDTLSPFNITNLTATPISNTEVDLSWSASTDNTGPLGYGVCNLNTNLMVDTTTSTSIRLTNLTPGTTYNLGVAAADGGGNFSGPATVSFTTGSIVTHTITASAGANGSISPSGNISGVVHNTSQSFTVTPSGGYQAVISGTCGGNLVGTTYTTNPITADCTVIANFNPTGSNQPLSPGNNVEVSVPVSLPSGGTGTVTVAFQQINTGGTLTITATDTPQGGGPPSGFKFLGTYYDVTFTGSFSGYIYITLPYDGSSVPSGKEQNLRLFHWKNPGWEDCTYVLDTANNKITGKVTSLSPFGFGYPYSSGSSSGAVGHGTGANENMIAFAILAISAGIFLLRRYRRFRKV